MTNFVLTIRRSTLDMVVYEAPWEWSVLIEVKDADQVVDAADLASML